MSASHRSLDSSGSGRKYSCVYFKGRLRIFSELFPPAFRRFSNLLGVFPVRSNLVVFHRETEVRNFAISGRIAWTFSIFTIPGSPAGELLGVSEQEPTIKLLRSLLFLITYRWSTMPRCRRFPFTCHALGVLRNRDFPQPFVTLGISRRGSHVALNRAWIVLTQFRYPYAFSFAPECKWTRCSVK